MTTIWIAACLRKGRLGKIIAAIADFAAIPGGQEGRGGLIDSMESGFGRDFELACLEPELRDDPEVILGLWLGSIV